MTSDGERAVPAPRRAFLTSALLFTGMTLVSRVLGLLREQLFAALFGASGTMQSDVFRMSFRIPNLLRDLFAEGALSAAFQPAFTRRLRLEGRASAAQLASKVITWILVVVGGLVLLGILLAPWMISLWAGGYAAVQGKVDLTVQLTRWMMPFLLLVSLAAVAMAMLNTEQRFVWPAVAPVLFNVVSIGVGCVLWFGLRDWDPSTRVRWWALGTLAAGVAQLVVQWPVLLRMGYRIRLQWDFWFKDADLRRIVAAMAPAAIGLMAVQINLLINSSIASKINGAQGWLESAFRLVQLPIGLFGVAIGTVAMTRYAEGAADRHAGVESMRQTCQRSLRLVVLLTAPCCLGLWILAEPLIRVLFQHGAFLPQDTQQTAAALRMYSLGLIPYALTKVVAPAFYAMDRGRIPVVATLLSVVVNASISLLATPHFGTPMLALGIAMAATCNALVLLVGFQWLVGGAFSWSVWVPAGKMLLGASVGAVFLVVGQRLLLQWLHLPNWLGASTRLTLLCLVGLGVGAVALYVVVGKWIRIAEIDELILRILRRRKS